MPVTPTRFLIPLLAVALTGCRDELADSDLDWQYEGFSSVQPALGPSHVYAAFNNGLVVAFERSSGDVVWARSLSGAARGRRLLLVDSVLVAPIFSLHGIDARSGNVLWTYPGPSQNAGFAVPARVGDTLYVADRLGQAAAINIHTGQQFWSTNVTETLFAPVVADSIVLFAGRGRTAANVLQAGHVFAFNRTTGQERWRFFIPDDSVVPYSGGAVSSGVVIGDRVIVGSMNSRIYALRLSDGALLWQYASGGAPNTQGFNREPLELDGAALFLRFDGRLIALEPSDGRVRWVTELTNGSPAKNDPVPCGSNICLGLGPLMVVNGSGSIDTYLFGSRASGILSSPPAIAEDGSVFVGMTRNDRNIFARVRTQLGLEATR